jgi:hypothetical protein
VTRQKVADGTALLVCAYESDDKFKYFQLDGAISFNTFKSMLGSMASDQEIIFYCN